MCAFSMSTKDMRSADPGECMSLELALSPSLSGVLFGSSCSPSYSRAWNVIWLCVACKHSRALKAALRGARASCIILPLGPLNSAFFLSKKQQSPRGSKIVKMLLLSSRRPRVSD